MHPPFTCSCYMRCVRLADLSMQQIKSNRIMRSIYSLASTHAGSDNIQLASDSSHEHRNACKNC